LTIKICDGFLSQAYIANASESIEYAIGYPNDPSGSTEGRNGITTGLNKVCGSIVDCELFCTNDICDHTHVSDIVIARIFAQGTVCYANHILP
jgi:hypothetical protein